MDPEKPENRVLSTISVVNSVEEIKIGLGRKFDSKKMIKEREAVLSKENLKAMKLQVGNRFDLHYNIG